MGLSQTGGAEIVRRLHALANALCYNIAALVSGRGGGTRTRMKKDFGSKSSICLNVKVSSDNSSYAVKFNMRTVLIVCIG